MKILKAIADFFKAEKTEYWHRDRSIEIVAKEKGIDIDVLKEETKAMLEKEGRVETIASLPTATAQLSRNAGILSNCRNRRAGNPVLRKGSLKWTRKQ